MAAALTAPVKVVLVCSDALIVLVLSVTKLPVCVSSVAVKAAVRVSGSCLFSQRDDNIPAVGLTRLDWFFLAVNLHNHLGSVGSLNGSILNDEFAD